MPQAKLSSQSIKQAIEDISGYPYELEIVRRVEAYKKYYCWVEPNYSFEDHDTGEARAEKDRAASTIWLLVYYQGVGGSNPRPPFFVVYSVYTP